MRAADLDVPRVGRGPAIVFVHGSIVGPERAWRKQLDLARNWELWLPNRPGFGSSPPLARGDFELEAPLIAALIERDAPFYDAVITREAIDGVTKFVREFGVIDRLIPYDEMVATEFSALWTE